MRHFKTFLTVIGAVTILVLAANSAVYAATGGKFILGHTNKANKVSTLKRTTSGAALNLVTKSSSNAPMTVNGNGKVAHLNADKLDGLDSSALKTRTYKYTLPATASVSTFDVALPGLPPGLYLAPYSVTATGAQINCDFTYANFDISVLSYGAAWNIYTTSNGSGVVDTRSQSVKFHCFSGTGSMTLLTADPTPQVTFTKIDTFGAVSGSAARVAGSSARTAR
jgi:hypothetical protein